MISIQSYFFQLDEGDRRGHDQKLFKKRFKLNVMLGNMRFRIELLMIGICCLPVALIANFCSTINTFKKHLSSELESEAVKFTVCQL